VPAIEALGVEHQSLAVPEQQLNQVTAAAAEREHLPAEWIPIQLLRNQGSEAIEAAAHVRRSGHQPDPHACRRCDHPRRAATTRRSAGRLTSPLTRMRTPPSSTISMMPVGRCFAAAPEAAARLPLSLHR
jgi:hypothetical protein